MAPPADNGLQLNARLYDVFPDDSALMVDRGPRRLTPEEAEAGKVTFELHGNGWRFEDGHSVRIELTQDDEPFLVHGLEVYVHHGHGQADSRLAAALPKALGVSATVRNLRTVTRVAELARG